MDDLQKNMNEAVNAAGNLRDIQVLFTSQVNTENVSVDRLKRTFVKNKSDINNYTDSFLVSSN